jgi:hypothetical protein
MVERRKVHRKTTKYDREKTENEQIKKKKVD